jgi:hypothetical protein
MATKTRARLSPAPKRWLRLTSPYVRGEDVRVLQVGINKRLRARGRARIKEDGEYGVKTRDALRAVLWHLGCPEEKLDNGATTAHQRIVRAPDDYRPKSWYSIANDRKKWEAKREQGRAAFVKWCQSYVGKVESPRDSNRGSWLDPLLRQAAWFPPPGVKGPPYCGIGLVVGLRKAGLDVPNAWAYTPTILSDARNGRYGFKLVDKRNRQPGDLYLIKIPGVSNDPVDHVGMIETKDGCIDFNTSPGRGGSQNNGGGVYRRKWSDRTGMVVAVVRPPW